MNLFIPQTWSWASLWMIYVCGWWLFDCVIIKIWFRSIWSISRVGKLVSFSLLKLSKTGLTYPLRFFIIFHCCLFWRAVWAKYLTTITTMMLSICDGKGYNTKKYYFTIIWGNSTRENVIARNFVSNVPDWHAMQFVTSASSAHFLPDCFTRSTWNVWIKN